MVRGRLRDDLALFCAVCFPDRFTSPANEMHRAMFARPKPAWTERVEPTLIADAAPRGGAKSTLASYASVIHDVAYGLEAFVAILSTTYALAEELVKDLHATLTEPEACPELHRLYGPFTVAGGATDFIVKGPATISQGVRIAAFSMSGTIRGQKHAGIRPTKVILDDCDHPEGVRSPSRRQKAETFLQADVRKAGSGCTVYHMLGTVLHPSSLLANALKSPGWSSTKWKAVLSWPDRMDLWADCRRLWADLTDAHRVETARTFYGRHRAEMDAGAKVLWPAHESLWDLMVLRWSDGEASFQSEKQNDPRDPSRQVFDVDAWRRCRFDGRTIVTAEGRRVEMADCTKATWLDPAIGEQLGNDFSAVATVARDPFGYRFVIRCSLHREAPHLQRARVWSVFDQLGPTGTLWGVEDNGFQALFGVDFEREREERRKALRVWTLPIRGYTSTQNKADRITRLEPDAANGWVQFADDLSGDFLDQAREFPTGAHDDGLDAVERADWLLISNSMPTLALGAL